MTLKDFENLSPFYVPAGYQYMGRTNNQFVRQHGSADERKRGLVVLKTIGVSGVKEVSYKSVDLL